MIRLRRSLSLRMVKKKMRKLSGWVCPKCFRVNSEVELSIVSDEKVWVNDRVGVADSVCFCDCGHKVGLVEGLGEEFVFFVKRSVLYCDFLDSLDKVLKFLKVNPEYKGLVFIR